MVLRFFKCLVMVVSIALSSFSKASADGIQVQDSFLCKSESGASAFEPNWDFKITETQRWKLKIKDYKTVTLGDDGNLLNGDLPIFAISPTKLVIQEAEGTFILSNTGRFTYAKVTVSHVEMLTGVCRKL